MAWEGHCAHLVEEAVRRLGAAAEEEDGGREVGGVARARRALHPEAAEGGDACARRNKDGGARGVHGQVEARRRHDAEVHRVARLARGEVRGRETLHASLGVMHLRSYCSNTGHCTAGRPRTLRLRPSGRWYASWLTVTATSSGTARRLLLMA